MSIWSELRSFIKDTTAPTKPLADPAGGDYQHDVTVSLTSADVNLEAIYYTLDGTEPNASSILYATSTGIFLSKDTTLKAIAYDKAGNVSDVMTETYGIAPEISSEVSTNIQETSFTATWSTDDPATSRVIYDTISHPTLAEAPNYGYTFSTTEDTATTTSHSVTITGLSSGTTYYYRNVSHASPEAVSDETSVTTAAATPTPPSSTSGGGNGPIRGDILSLTTPPTLPTSQSIVIATSPGISASTGGAGVGAEETVSQPAPQEISQPSVPPEQQPRVITTSQPEGQPALAASVFGISMAWAKWIFWILLILIILALILFYRKKKKEY